MGMVWNAAAPPAVAGKVPRPKRRGGAPVLLLLLAPVVSGCETMERMDYLDRFFEPTPRPVTAAAATEPLQNPTSVLPPATDSNPQPAAVVAMEPIENTADRWPAAERPPQQAAVRAAGPRPDPGASPAAADAESRTRLLIRQNPWLTRFWMELTPAQRARVERRLLRGGDVRLASGQAEPAIVWDPMGLSDRVNLVFGGGASSGRVPPAGNRDASALAGDP